MTRTYQGRVTWIYLTIYHGSNRVSQDLHGTEYIATIFHLNVNLDFVCKGALAPSQETNRHETLNFDIFNRIVRALASCPLRTRWWGSKVSWYTSRNSTNEAWEIM